MVTLQDIIAEMRTVAMVAGQASIEGPDDALSQAAEAEALRARRWADALDRLLAPPAVDATARLREQTTTWKCGKCGYSLGGITYGPCIRCGAADSPLRVPQETTPDDVERDEAKAALAKLSDGIVTEHKQCAICGAVQPCREHGRTPVDVADFEELSRFIDLGTIEPYTVDEAARTIYDTFKRDEADGYRNRDRQFAIALLARAFESTPSDPAGSTPSAQGVTESAPSDLSSLRSLLQTTEAERDRLQQRLNGVVSLLGVVYYVAPTDDGGPSGWRNVRAEKAEAERDEARAAEQATYAKFAPICEALGLFDGARPVSLESVVRNEVLPVIEALKTNSPDAGIIVRENQRVNGLWRDALSRMADANRCADGFLTRWHEMRDERDSQRVRAEAAESRLTALTQAQQRLIAELGAEAVVAANRRTAAINRGDAVDANVQYAREATLRQWADDLARLGPASAATDGAASETPTSSAPDPRQP